MNNARSIVSAIVFSIGCAGAHAQPSNLHGSSGDKQDVTANTGSEGRPNKNAKETAEQKKSLEKNSKAEEKPVKAPRDSAAPTNSAGVPAENSAQPEQAK